MTDTTYMKLPEIAPGQKNKYLTHNQALALIEKWFLAPLTKDLAAADVTLTAQEFREAGRFYAANCDTAGRKLILPTGEHLAKEFYVKNNTSSSEGLIVKKGATEITLPVGEARKMQTDGTADGLETVTGDVNLDFIDLGDVPSAYTGEAGKLLAVNGSEDGVEFIEGTGGASFIAGGGPWEFIGTHSPGAVNSYEITDIGNANHKALLLVYLGVAPATDDAFLRMTFKKNGGEKTAGYSWSTGNLSSAASAGNSGGEASAHMELIRPVATNGVGNSTNESLGGFTFIFGPHMSIQHRILSLITHSLPTGNNKLMRVLSDGAYHSTDVTSPIESLFLKWSSGNFAGGTILVFGLRADNKVAPYLVNQYTAGEFANDQTLLYHVFTEDVDFEVNFAGCEARCQVDPAATANCDILINGSSVGTMTFAMAANTATFSVAGAESPVAGDYIEIRAPSSADADLAGVTISLRAALQ